MPVLGRWQPRPPAIPRVVEIPPPPTDNRRAQVSWSELEVPLAPRRAQVSWAELEVPSVGGEPVVAVVQVVTSPWQRIYGVKHARIR